ncbi:hypothetical protein CC80DRAFT_180616 [Byssothecium circinans]|uniref:non-specific serine/threonine protein kinase n=1 Tax=Byssothecium circinans TaxID=147558 RepID=A0A6A5TKD7_9PLEO|nr:hypothetical protein CC80DRAFT_180616 [Byssothecium circinans]
MPLGDQLYMEYCEAGPLSDIIEIYKRKGLFIPEMFLWEVTESIARALLFIHLGHRSLPPAQPAKKSAKKCSTKKGSKTSDSVQEGWVPVTHQDIGAANVFLTEKDAPKLYPRVVLGDFGNAFFISNLSEGSEMRDLFNVDFRQLGEVLENLMSCEGPDEEYMAEYSSDLRELVDYCEDSDNAEVLLRHIFSLKSEID